MSRGWWDGRYGCPLLAGSETITRAALTEVFAEFLPSTEGIEKELQELAAILECTDRQFLPAATAKRMDSEGRARNAAAVFGAQAAGGI